MILIVRTLDKVFDIIELLILARIIISYIPNLRGSQITEIIYQLTEPILHPVRELLYKIGLNKGMIDFSPIGAFLLLAVIRSLLFSLV
ncbi:YggT family protein [Dethiosulfatibacter aminovorans DSM 17477]|uniref:YggT family protein n=1 Tax=Dethiosulfatibacter aminovorans DSM 17477 TaxID=1121476 RepID=A0A1M6DJV0_9FIRM|nr:YggT family protein [Dethiosulfatibacter aminovorans]SHI73472.1 YggT family protein [Dethiosulfatibacter aminovorans DSM 17477]